MSDHAGFYSGRLYTGQDGRRWRFMDCGTAPGSSGVAYALVRRADPGYSESSLMHVVVPWKEWTGDDDGDDDRLGPRRRAPRFASWETES